jgi:3-hydroxybutyryl-CoA dehydratase
MACLSKVLGMDFPGVGAIYLSQEIRFLSPVFVGNEIQIQVRIEHIDTAKRVLRLSSFIRNLTKNMHSAEGISQIKMPRN